MKGPTKSVFFARSLEVRRQDKKGACKFKPEAHCRSSFWQKCATGEN